MGQDREIKTWNKEIWSYRGNDRESITGAKDGEIRTCGTDVEAEGEAEDEVEDG